jgi:RNA-directed DNA polymerase
MAHDVLLKQCKAAELSAWHIALIDAYLRVPDRSGSRMGLTAGGALSPLLAALYLTPLDRAMEVIAARHDIHYMRYMDDFVIFASTRFHIRRAIRTVHQVLSTLKLRVHPLKRFIGRTTKGFDFLGYRFVTDRGLDAAAKTTAKMLGRVRRLQEQGADVIELRRYVLHWWRWLHAGLRGQVTRWKRFPDLMQELFGSNVS